MIQYQYDRLSQPLVERWVDELSPEDPQNPLETVRTIISRYDQLARLECISGEWRD